MRLGERWSSLSPRGYDPSKVSRQGGIVARIAYVYVGFPANYFSGEICVPRGTRPACWPARLKIQRCLTGETVCRESSCRILDALAGVYSACSDCRNLTH